MDTQVLQELTLDERMTSLKEKLRKGEVDLTAFKQAYQHYTQSRENLRELLEWATEQRKGDKELLDLYSRLAGDGASDLMEQLKRIGFGIRKNPDLRKAFENQGYRLLEQTRLGNLDAVYYGLLRIFVNRRDFPAELVQAFKPIYSPQISKIFIFSFLSGVLGKEE